MPLTFHFAARSDVGLVRSENQDSGYAGPHLLAVADGMGGHAGGDIASSVAVGELVGLDDDSLSSNEAPTRLTRSLANANGTIGDLMAARPELQGMGTTATVILRSRNKLTLAHIGDSRAYLLREGKLSQLTHDHSFVQTLVDEGRITEEEAEVHPQRSLVTRVLTGQPSDDPDVNVRECREGDRYLLCSDGLSGVVERDTIAEILSTVRSPGAAADRLVELALKSGAPDNVTVVIGDTVDITKGAPPTEPQVVGAAARRRRTRPTPDSPAARAAALTRAQADDDELSLAEEGPRSRAARLLRGLAATLAVLLVVGAAGFALWDWSQKQYYVGTDNGYVAVYRGVPQDIGGLELASMEERTTIRTENLPEFYRSKVESHLVVADKAAADRLVATLKGQESACYERKSRGEPCGSGPINPSSTTSTTSTTSAPTSPTSASPASGATGSTAPASSRPKVNTSITTGATP
ncbi:MAG: Stp1/IreP family PP2C-type Ser/Thr phosphatase [Micrococcales bacterium]|nr:Stp1/IreP family PP2C-type Ser/Thr phosphatase [Micrococcales bacterium]